jgi:hypothetical protein
MKNWLITLVGSWSCDTPPEVIWAINELIANLNTVHSLSLEFLDEEWDQLNEKRIVDLTAVLRDIKLL